MTEERNPDEQVEDLDVPEEDSEDVKGGASRPADGDLSPGIGFKQGLKIDSVNKSGFNFHK
jgi:hypothetical protein